MIEAARLGIYVGAETGDAKRGLEGVSGMVESAGAKMTSWGLKLSALVTAPLMAIGKYALGAGSDLAESASKVDVVFKESAGIVEEFAATAADSFGIAEQAALETTGTFGNLFTSMGLGREASAAMSVDLVELAADLASFNNIDSSIALEKLRAGLVGEAEPLRTLGVNLSEAGAKAKAMAMGLAESEKALTAADLVQARYALILEQTTNAQGDFARTAGGLANSQRILTAQLQNVAATLGQMLLPVALRMVQAFSNLLQRFQGLSPATQRFIVIAGGIAAAVGPALLVIGSLVKTVMGLSGAFAAIGAAVSPVLLPIAGVAAAVAGLALAWKTNFLGIRDVVGPVVDRIVSVIGTAIKVFQMWRDQTGSVSQGIVGALNSIGLMVPSLKGFTSGLAEIIQTVAHFLTEGELLTDYFVTLPQPIQNAVLAVLNFMGNLVDGVRTALSTMRDWWNAHWPAMQTAVSTWWTNVQPKLAEAYTAIRDKVGQAVVDVRGWWDSHWPAMQTAVSTWWSNVQPKLADAYTAIRDKVGQAVVDVRGWWDEHWPAMQTAVSTWWTNIKPKLAKAYTAIRDKVGQAVVDVRGWWDSHWPAMQTAVSTWWSNVQPKLADAYTAIRDKVGQAVVDVRGWWDEHWPAMQTAVSTWWTNVQPKLAEAYTAIRDKVGQAAVDVRGWWDSHWPAMQTAVSTWWTDIQPKLADAYTAIRDKVGQAVVDVRGWWDEHWPAMQTAVSTWWTNIKDKLDDAATAINDKVGQAVVDLKDSFEENWPKARTAIETWWTAVQPKLDEAIDYFSNQLVVAVQGVATAFEENWPKAQAAVSDWWTETKSSLEEAATQIGTTLPEAMDAMTEKFGPLIEAQKKYYDLFPQLIELSESFRDVGDAIKEKMGEWIEFGWSVLLEKLQEIGKYLAETFQPAWDTLKKVYDDTATAISTVLIDAFESLKAKFDVVKPVADIFAGAMSAISGAIDSISSAIQSAITWLSNLADKIRNLPSPPGIHVPGSPTPFANGLRSEGEAARYAAEGIGVLAQALNQDLSATGMIQGIITDANTLLGIASPSTVFMEIGIQMIEGLLAGIDSKEAEAAAKVAGFLDTIVGMFRDVLGFVGELNGLVGAGPLVTSSASLPQPLVFLQHVLLRMGELMRELMAEPALANLGEEFGDFVERIARVVGPFGEALRFIDDLSSLVQGGPVVTNSATLPQPLVFLRDVLRRMGELMQALVSDPVLAEVDEWTVLLAERLGGLVGPLQDVLGFMSDLDAFWEAGALHGRGQDGGRLIAAQIGSLASTLGLMATEMQRVQGWTQFADLGAEFAAFAETVGAVVGPLQDVLGFMSDLDAFWEAGALHGRGQDGGRLIAAQIGSLASTLGLMATELRRVQGWTQFADLGAEFAAFAETVGAVVGPLQDVLGFMSDLDAFWEAGALHGRGQDGGRLIAAQIGSLASTLGLMATELRRVQGWTQFADLGAEFAAFAETVGAVVGPLQDVLGFMSDLDAFWEAGALHGRGQDGGRLIAAQIASLASTLGLMATEMQRVQGWTQFADLGAEFAAFAETVGAVVGPLQDVLGFIGELGLWKQAPDLHERMAAFVTAWTDVLLQLAAMAVDTRAVADEDMRRFASAAGDIGAGLQRAVGFLVDLGAWKKAENLEELIDELVRVTEYTLAQLAEAVDGWTDEGLELVMVFGQAIGSVMGGLQAAFQMAAEAPSEWGLDEGLWQAFFEWVTAAFTQFAAYVAAWAAEQEDPGNLVGLVGSVAAALSSVMQALQAAADFELGADWTAPEPGLWAAFFEWVTGVFTQFSAYVATWAAGQADPGNLVGLVGSVAAALSSVMQALQAAADFELGADWTAPEPGLWAAFFEWVTGVFTQFSAYVATWAAGQADPGNLVGLVGSVAAALSSVMAGLQAAADFELGATWTAPEPGLWAAFFEWVTGVFTQFSAYVATWAAGQADPGNSASLVAAVAGALSSVMQAAQAALELAAVFPDDWSEPDPAEMAAFIAWVEGVFQELYDWVVTNLPDTAAAAATMPVVAAMGTAMVAVFDGLQAALDLSQGFWFTEPNTGLWDEFMAWVEGVFQELYDWVVREYPQSVAEATETFAPVVVFANALGAIVGALQGALELFAAIMDTDTAAYSDTEGFSLFEDRVGWLMEGIDMVLDAFYVWVMNRDDAWMTTAVAFADATGAVFDVLAQALEVFGALNDENIPSTAEIEAFIEAVLNLFGMFTASLLTSGSEIESAVADTGETVWGLAEYLPDEATVSGWGSEIGSSLGAGLTGYETAGDVSTMASGLSEQLAAYLGVNSDIYADMWGFGGQNAYKMVAALASYMASASAAGVYVNQSATSLAGYLAAYFGSSSDLADDDMPDWGQGLSGSMTGGLMAYMASSAAKADMTTMASNLWWAVQNAIFNGSDPLNQLMWDAGWGVGQDLVLGLAAGMKNWNGAMYSAIDQAVSYIVDYIIHKIDEELGISSPSRVFAEIGHFIPLGLAVGIEDGIPAVRSAAAELFAAVGEYTGGQDWRIQPSTVAVTQRQRVEVVVSGDVSVGGERLSVAQREDIAQVIIQRLRSRG